MDRRTNNPGLAFAFAVLMMTSALVGGVTFAGTAAAAPGDVVYRVNAGGPELAASDGGPAWTADTASDPSQYHNPTGQLSTVSVSSADPSVPASTPTDVFASARWDEAGGEELAWEFPVSGGAYEVRLYFADGYADSVGQRVFDAAIEDETVLDGYDIVADVGTDTGTMRSFTATVSDGTLDIDFAHAGANNPIVSAIEIVEADAAPGELGAAPEELDFGSVVVGETATETVTLTNLGGPGDTDISVGGVSAGGDFSAALAGDAVLAPGESTAIDVTYAPGASGSANATLDVTHNGTNGLSVPLSGSGTNDVPVSFGASTLDLSGANLGAPTSIEFGPDGRLYVAERYGVVKAFEVNRTDENSYEVESSETIAAINDLQNHNDDGSTDGVPADRQLTGITVGGTASNPTVYATSSDPRHYSSPQGDRSEIMDTNSGVVSRLTWTGNDWEHVALVRGLPRSTELHSTNDLQLEESTNTLYIAQGGNSGAGAPNDKFSYTAEYAYSAAILSVDLDAIGSMSTKTDTGDVPYKHDLPTLNPSVSVAPDDTPFGGLGGQNMAVLTEDSPVQVYASGLRNSYDVTLTADGQLYATDNGVGGGWGAPPVNEGAQGVCTNEPNSGGSEDPDQLHLIEEDGYYGHPNPTRGNPGGAGLYDIDSDSSYTQVGNDSILADAVPAASPEECDYRQPGAEDGALTTFGSSTNGIDEYSASNFGSKMAGDLLTASFDGNVRRVQLNAAGDAVTDREPVFSNGLGTPLDVHAQGDAGPFPGTVWVADFGDGDLHVYEPIDYEGTGGDVPSCDPSSLPDSGDADGDGFTNGDEIAVGTDPCSAASAPDDADGDGTPDALDPDDDNDGQPDTTDPFALDPANGANTTVPLDCPADETVSTETCLRFGQSSFPGTLLGLGFTGLMNNGTDYAKLHDPSNVQAGGAADTLGLETVTAGSAYGSTNTQEYAYQFGANPPNESFVVHSRILGGFDGEVPEEYQNYGIYFGDGTQSNYAKLVIGARDPGEADGEVEFVVEEADNPTSTKLPESGIVGNNVELYLTVHPTTDPTPNDGSDDAAVSAEYAIGDGERVHVANGSVPASWVTGDSVAVGVMGTATGSGETYPASYDLLEVERTAEGGEESGTEESVYRVNAGGSELAASDDGPVWEADTNADPSEYRTSAGTDESEPSGPDGDAVSLGPAVPESTPADLYQSTRYDPETGSEMSWGFPTAAGASYELRVYVAETYLDSANVGSNGPRVFDVAVEGETVLDDYDMYEELGHDNGTMLSFPVSPEDGALNVTFLHEAENPMIAGLEVVRTDGEDPAPPEPAPDEPGAAVSITPDGGVDATTWDNNAYTVENTGEVAIESVTIDTSTAILPDLVFDPYGTAGDGGDKSFQAGAGSDDVGLVSTADDDIFAAPHNDAGGDDGFERMELDFTGFEPGESLVFGSDGDPTSIKGAQNDAQNTLAGPVSGAELAGSTVTVTFADGTSETFRTFGDGSAGGSEGETATDRPAAPTLGLQAGTLDAGALDARHAAAGVAAGERALTVSGPANATVTVMEADTELNLVGVPDYDGTPGYDIEPYEGNNFLGVTYHEVALGPDGTGTVNVTVAEEGPTYAMAAVAGDPRGEPSNVAVLEAREGPGPVGAFPNAPNDPDGDGVYEDVNGDGVVNVGDAQALYSHLTDDAVTGSPDAFDANGDGVVNVGDAQALFADLGGA
jgi:hypothetical protein